MSIEKNINENLTSRAYQITIDKTIKDNPSFVIKYTNDSKFLGQKSILVSDLISDGLVTEAQSIEIESLFKALADEFNPYKEEAE